MFKRYLVTGLLIWVPLVVTLWVLNFFVTTLESVVPEFIAQPINELLISIFGQGWTVGRYIPGVRLLFVIIVVMGTGLIAANFLGKKLVQWWEAILSHIPLVRSIYNSVKQVSDTVLAPNGQAFRKALLVQYPRQGSWTIGFLTGEPSGELASIHSKPMVSVYVPTTPNPTSGFFLMMPKEDVLELDMTVDTALKYVVSMGVVSPD